MRFGMVWVAGLMLLGACSQRDDGASAEATERARRPEAPATVAAASPIPAAAAAATPIPGPIPAPIPAASMAREDDTPRSCGREIGAAAAARRVAVCRDVSPATHPPCNALNSCAMIEDEIARSCALFDGQGTPMKGCGPAPRSMEAAADVVRRYYSAIDARDYATAWTQWGDAGRPGQTLAAFERGFAHTRSTHVTIGRLQPGDGGAGSIYQPVPVTVEATLDDGTRQRFVGTYVVRRVNGVDGATPGQLRWHIGSATLKPAG